jgi:hypothetical protein
MSLNPSQHGKNDSVSVLVGRYLLVICFRAESDLAKELGYQGNNSSRYQYCNCTNGYYKPLVRSPFRLIIGVFNTGFTIS